jgi:D-alanyl-D-alanine carboxypeptidase (penicillin-binding protein 5/6)
MQVICVVLNDYDWFNDSKVLMEKAFNEYYMVQIAQKEKIVFNTNILYGKTKKCAIIAKEDVFYPLKKGEYLKAHYDLPLEISRPVTKGEFAGRVSFYLNGEKVKEAECIFQ